VIEAFWVKKEFECDAVMVCNDRELSMVLKRRFLMHFCLENGGNVCF
jgi:hypothetical protein